MRRFILGALLAGLSVTASATVVDNGDFTTDLDNGLDWLDLSFTNNLSYDYVASQTGVGGQFEGWSLATASQIFQFFDSAGGDGSYGDNNNQIVTNTLYPLWGQMPYSGSSSWFHFQDVTPGFGTSGMVISSTSSVTVYNDNFSSPDSAYFNIGTALVRTSVVPVPAAVCLFGSALAGLGWMRRKRVA